VLEKLKTPWRRVKDVRASVRLADSPPASSPTRASLAQDAAELAPWPEDLRAQAHLEINPTTTSQEAPTAPHATTTGRAWLLSIRRCHGRRPLGPAIFVQRLNRSSPVL